MPWVDNDVIEKEENEAMMSSILFNCLGGIIDYIDSVGLEISVKFSVPERLELSEDILINSDVPIDIIHDKTEYMKYMKNLLSLDKEIVDLGNIKYLCKTRTGESWVDADCINVLNKFISKAKAYNGYEEI